MSSTSECEQVGRLNQTDDTPSRAPHVDSKRPRPSDEIEETGAAFRVLT